MDPSDSLESQLLGQTIAGRYRLNSVQASGAFGTVFHAHQFFCKQFMRPVAVKVSRQVGLTEETAPALFGDAIVLARLLAEGHHDHKGRAHLVQIFDMGLLPEHEDRAFLAMEYVDGLPLLSHMRAAGRISVGTGLRFVKQICHALSLVHGQGVVHRDLKADNILVDRRGVVRVVDFGLAAFADERFGFVPGALGTFTYMAPETIYGRSTPASDVYSLGLLMYELFTGGGPHLGAPWRNDDKDDRSDENYRIKKSFRFAPPSAVQNEIRNDYRWLDSLILRCLETEPARRFADAGAHCSRAIESVRGQARSYRLCRLANNEEANQAETSRTPNSELRTPRTPRRSSSCAKCGGCWRPKGVRSGDRPARHSPPGRVGDAGHLRGPNSAGLGPGVPRMRRVNGGARLPGAVAQRTGKSRRLLTKADYAAAAVGP